MTEAMRIFSWFSWICLAGLAILCACPGEGMDSAAYAQSVKSNWQLIIFDNMRVTYYEKPHVQKDEICTMLFYDDSRDMWRLDSNGLVLREKWSKFYPRIKECWLINN